VLELASRARDPMRQVQVEKKVLTEPLICNDAVSRDDFA
jgi:hypothetical protein